MLELPAVSIVTVELAAGVHSHHTDFIPAASEGEWFGSPVSKVARMLLPVTVTGGVGGMIEALAKLSFTGAADKVAAPKSSNATQALVEANLAVKLRGLSSFKRIFVIIFFISFFMFVIVTLPEILPSLGTVKPGNTFNCCF